MRGRLAALLACVVALAGAIAVLGGTGARAAAGAGCGTVVVGPSGGAAFSSVNTVSARATSCPAARALVRAWALAAEQGRIPARVVTATGHGGVIVYGRPGAPYRFRGYTCRWTNTNPGHSAYLPGQGRCVSGRAVVAWRYHGASNPTVGATHGCASVGWPEGDASVVRARGVGCAVAVRVVRAVLDGRAIGRDGGRLEVRRRSVDGFRVRATGADGRLIVLTRGRVRITFALCWFGVDC